MNPQSAQQKVDLYSGGPATLEYVIAIITAYAAGKKIQYRPINKREYGWANLSENIDLNNIRLNLSHYDFRIDPTDRPKKKVPLEVSDLGPTTWLRGPNIHKCRLNQSEALIIAIDNDSVYIMPNGILGFRSFLKLDDLFDDKKQIGTHEYSYDRKVWLPTHKEVICED